MTSKYFVPLMLFMLIGYAAIGAIPAVKALPTCKITSISTPSIAEPSTGSPGDKDGFPDGSKIGSADPSDFQIVVNCTVDTAISGVEIELINTNHDPNGDESPIVTDFEIDDDNPRTVGSLAPGNYYFFWSLNKDQTVAMKNNAEQYRVNLSWTSPSPGYTLSELFNILCDGSASIAQSDLETVQTYPAIFTNLEMVPGERFTVCILWEQSSSSLDDLVASIYY
ncbi:MAG: hypothetical protein GKB99_05195, partial [Methanocellales archaeon]|nr:hypothetical protein [Methanocellales archaeon]